MILIKRKKAGSNPLDSGSMSDLAFLLIIYFIVIAGFNVNMGYLLNLPGKDSQRVVNTLDLIKLRLNATGELYLAQEPSSFQGVETAIKAALGRRPNLTVLLNINPACPWQKVVDVIGMAQRTSVENFSFKLETTQELP